jgi:hypothetical protein
MKYALLLLLTGALFLSTGFIWGQTKGAPAQNPAQKKAADQKQAESDQDYTEEEYNAYEAANNEKDTAKKAQLCIEFLEKYPKSTLKNYVVNIFETLLYETAKANDYAKLMTFAESWAKINPSDIKSQAYLFDAAVALGQHAKVIEFGEKLYAQQPSAKLALPIYQAYDKLGNASKKEEWALKMLQYPEYKNDLQLRMQLVIMYAEKDLPKASGYAQQALSAVPGATKPASMSEADWTKGVNDVKKACYNIVGMNEFAQKKYAEAIKALTQANQAAGKNIEADKFDSGYYYIAMSQWQTNQIEDAYHSFFIASMIKGSLESKALKNASDLYKSTHNNTEVSMDREIRRARADLDALIKGEAK